jgi:two-component system cell cycle sensor histidine kinase/response regulator CckA
MVCDTADDVRSLASEAAETRTRPARDAPPTGQERAGLPTILVVDDEEGVRELVCRVLRFAGYPVLRAAGGEEALALAERHPGVIGLVLSDILMPDMEGQELADLIRARWPDVRVLLMTGGDAAASGALAKPFTVPVLLNAVRSALSARDKPA